LKRAVPLLVILFYLLPFAAAPSYALPVTVFRVEAQNLAGNPIAAVQTGADFMLAAYVRDIRNPADQFPGVWAAFMNVTYNPSLVSIASTAPNPAADPGNNGDPGIAWGNYFSVGLRFGDLSAAGHISDIGSLSLRNFQSGTGDVLLWQIKAHASTAGTLTFTPSFDSNFFWDSSFVDPPTPFTQEDIQFGGATITIVPEPSSFVLVALGLIGCLAWAGRRGRLPGSAWRR